MCIRDRANDAARRTAEMLDGDPWGAWNETMLDAPTTAHILGGCVIGDSPGHGVIDPYQRVWGYDGLHISDGSAVSANLGVNPSLTITAQTSATSSSTIDCPNSSRRMSASCSNASSTLRMRSRNAASSVRLLGRSPSPTTAAAALRPRTSASRLSRFPAKSR